MTTLINAKSDDEESQKEMKAKSEWKRVKNEEEEMRIEDNQEERKQWEQKKSYFCVTSRLWDQ